jgi:hypothetical protein
MRIEKPISQKDADASGFEPWRAGEYDFTVQAAEETTASSGNDMIKLTLHVFNEAGRHRVIFDYLVNSEKVQYKIRHFADAVGLTRQYESGELSEDDCVERSGRLKLGIKPANGNYPAGNDVRDYLPRKAGDAPVADRPAVRQKAKAVADLDDEIPFAPEFR